MEVQYLVLLLSLIWHGTDAIMWSLAPNTHKCLKEELHANVLVAGEYDVTEIQGQRVDYIVSIISDITKNVCNIQTPWLMYTTRYLSFRIQTKN